MVERGIPQHSMGRFITQLEEIRVSTDAKKALKEFCEKESRRIIEKALLFMRHTKRKTLQIEDIELAIKELNL